MKAPIVFAPEEVYNLKRPGMDHPVFERVLDALAYWQEETGGAIPLGTTDPQSPLDVASLIWDSRDFLPSLYTNPKEVHYLLDMVTGVFIDFYSRQLKLIGNFAHPVHTFPLVNTSDGISLSDDQMVLLSPLFVEFDLPYLDRIADMSFLRL